MLSAGAHVNETELVLEDFEICRYKQFMLSSVKVSRVGTRHFEGREKEAFTVNIEMRWMEGESI